MDDALKARRVISLAQVQARVSPVEREFVPAPELVGADEDAEVGVWIKPMGKGARDRIGARAYLARQADDTTAPPPPPGDGPESTREVDLATFMREAFLECVVEPRFDRQTVEALWEQPHLTAALDRVVGRIMAISGLEGQDQQVARRTFRPGPGEAGPVP